jgi:hypothetical protein
MRRWLFGGVLAAVVIVALSTVQAARHATGVWYQDRSFIGSAVIGAVSCPTPPQTAAVHANAQLPRSAQHRPLSRLEHAAPFTELSAQSR